MEALPQVTEQEYRNARRELRRLNRMIDKAPMTAKPVFRGICELHAVVADYERYKIRAALRAIN